MSRRQHGQQNTRKPHVPQKTVQQQSRGFKGKRDANTGLLHNCVVTPAADEVTTMLFLSALAISMLGNRQAELDQKNNTAPAPTLFDAKNIDRVVTSQSNESPALVATTTPSASAAVM